MAKKTHPKRVEEPKYAMGPVFLINVFGRETPQTSYEIYVQIIDQKLGKIGLGARAGNETKDLANWSACLTACYLDGRLDGDKRMVRVKFDPKTSEILDVKFPAVEPRRRRRP